MTFLAPLNAQFAIKFNAHKKKYPKKRDTWNSLIPAIVSPKAPLSPDNMRKFNKTRYFLGNLYCRISKLRTSRMIIAQNESNRTQRKTFLSPFRNSKLPTSINIPLEPIAEHKTPKPKGSAISPRQRRPKRSRMNLLSPSHSKEGMKTRRPRRHLSNTPTLHSLF